MVELPAAAGVQVHGVHRVLVLAGDYQIVPVNHHLRDLQFPVLIEYDGPGAGGGIDAVDGLIAAAPMVVDLPVVGNDLSGIDRRVEGGDGDAVIPVERGLPPEGEVEDVPVKHRPAPDLLVGDVLVHPVLVGGSRLAAGGDDHSVVGPVPLHVAVQRLRHRPDGHQGPAVESYRSYIQLEVLGLTVAHLLCQHIFPQLHGNQGIAPLGRHSLIFWYPLHCSAQLLENGPEGHQHPPVLGDGRLIEGQLLPIHIHGDLAARRLGDTSGRHKDRRQHQHGKQPG